MASLCIHLQRTVRAQKAENWEVWSRSFSAAWPLVSVSPSTRAPFLLLAEDWLPLFSWAWFIGVAHKWCPWLTRLLIQHSYCTAEAFYVPLPNSCEKNHLLRPVQPWVRLSGVARGQNEHGFRACRGEVGGAWPLPDAQDLRAFHSILSRKKWKGFHF